MAVSDAMGCFVLTRIALDLVSLVVLVTLSDDGQIYGKIFPPFLTASIVDDREYLYSALVSTSTA